MRKNSNESNQNNDFISLVNNWINPFKISTNTLNEHALLEDNLLLENPVQNYGANQYSSKQDFDLENQTVLIQENLTEQKKFSEQNISPQENAFYIDIEESSPIEINSQEQNLTENILQTKDEIENKSECIDEDGDTDSTENEENWNDFFKRKLSAIADLGKYTLTHPLTIFLAISSAAPPAINALAAPSGKDPKMIGKEWWDQMSAGLKTHSILNSLSSFTVNAIMNALFISSASSLFKKSIKQIFRTPKDFFDNFFSILLAIAAAIAAAAISYEAFLFLPYGTVLALIPSFFNVLITFASRYIGIKNIFDRLINFFSESHKSQHEFVSVLDRLNSEYFSELKKELNQMRHKFTPAEKLTHLQMEQIANQVMHGIIKLQSEGHSDLIRNKSYLDSSKEWGALLFDLCWGVCLISVPSFFTHMDKGWHAVNEVSKLTTHSDLNNSLNDWYKRLIGSLPGFGSAILYANYGMDFRQTIVELVYYLRQHPHQIPVVVGLLIANGFASSSMQNIAKSIVNDNKNILDLQQSTPLAGAFVGLNALAGGVVNSTTSLTRAFQLHTFEPSVKANGDLPNIPEIKNYFSKNNHTFNTKQRKRMANNLSRFKNLTYFASAPSSENTNLLQNNTHLTL